jgi:hypothetical protein
MRNITASLLELLLLDQIGIKTMYFKLVVIKENTFENRLISQLTNELKV